ncbi:MAG: hypothetical protein HYX99_01575 [Chloroflexi bacterium]|nr:hypothetical protein [Chloroflexota bacterium]
MVRRAQPDVFRLLADVPQEKRFWCQDGRVLGNIQELESALPNLSPDAWQHHTGQGRNDFANWVRDVIGDSRLAADLLKSPTPGAAAQAIRARITQLQRRRRVA